MKKIEKYSFDLEGIKGESNKPSWIFYLIMIAGIIHSSLTRLFKRKDIIKIIHVIKSLFIGP